MKTAILAALVVILEAGFIASIAMAPSPQPSPQGGPDVVAGRNATELRAAPASRG